MNELCVVNVDLADVFASADREHYLHSLAWGDYVEVLEKTEKYLRIATVKYVENAKGILPEATEAFICPARSSGVKPSEVVIRREASKVLKVNFVDVQQGDGAVIESPDGTTILVDGGDTRMFARYLAARYRDSSDREPRAFDCILVTHGDADHFAGLTEIWRSEANPEKRKRLFAAPRRVYHNGLVKRPAEDANDVPIPVEQRFGACTRVGDETIITGLVSDPLAVSDSEMSRDFRAWKKALAAWNTRHPIEFRRLAFGDDHAFDFFNRDGLEIRVLGPLLTDRDGVMGLRFLGKPPKGPRVGHESLDVGGDDFPGLDVAHTINGHSIVFRLRYGGFSYLFCGDLNEEAGRTLAAKCETGEVVLRSEVFKVPHHGSADFSGSFLHMVQPLVSVISSGDESSRKEYIHPRATLLGALGRHSRGDEPLIFVTELVAFFKTEGWARHVKAPADDEAAVFYAFSRTAYGIVKTRTDGKRMLVYTDSGKADLKEAYCYALDQSGAAVPVGVVRV